MGLKQKKRGFTLLETLVVLGILVVLLAIAVPAVYTIQTNLKMKELDDTARQIFLVVQNRLTTMKATGELQEFQKQIERDMDSQKLKNPSDCPQDYGEGDDDWKELFYLKADQALSKTYLLTNTDVLTGVLQSGSFMIELNPYSGDVYSVFYIEQGTVEREQVMSLADRNIKSRKKATPMLGYYGGHGGLSAGSEIPTKFEPKLTLINGEDLYVMLQCSGMRKLISTQRNLLITITVMDEAFDPSRPGAHIWRKELKGGTDFAINATGELAVNLTLDSLRSGESFQQITNSALTPGDNIKIVATISYVHEGVPVEGEARVEGNSLFDKRGPAETAANTTLLQVSRVRHLNNLQGTIYQHAAGTQALSIVQTSEINFDQTQWKDGEMTPGKGLPNLPYFTPIENYTMFSYHTTPVSYDGKGNQLRNFIFSSPSKSNVGLFSQLNDCTVTGVRLADSKVNGNYSFVGLLAAEATDCTITDSWAFLNTLDADGRFTIDDAFVGEHTIAVSGNTVGGLVGRGVDTQFNYCIGAVPITGGSQIGGLVGDMRGGSIKNSYSSGDIVAKGAAGGLVGKILVRTVTVTDCYSSANVTTPNNGGGMVGRTECKVIFQNCTSYGEVKIAAGSWDVATSGPFVGNQLGTYPNTYTNCKYFAQGNYNNNYTISKGYGVATGFMALCTKKPNAVETSFPYTKQLNGGSFPFPLIKQADGVAELNHYGNWPAELRLQSSLVYYEKYGENDYGYYAVTSLTTKGDDTGSSTGGSVEEDVNKWEVDTLRDETCIEDGYALMTIYNLAHYTYRLENGTELSVQVVDDPALSDGSKSVKIASNISLLFSKEGLTYRISNANVYQLPFDLQIVNRITPASFYTKLVVNGYLADNKKVVDDFTFFYCPDFAKNAVNPDPDAMVVNYPPDPNGEEKPVYVRSARQFNGLGRSYYYWSTKNSSATKSFYFKQQTELDFGRYTKTYCGKTYNLMDTSITNIYRNKPIGRPGNQAGAQFTFTYDGGANKIIDYCLETYPADFNDGSQKGFQYTGMFGEIQYATLKNIVMVASQPGGDYETSSGYVKSNYEPGSNAGTGALVGLVYVAGDKDPDSTRARIINCTVSGYEVSYTATRKPDNEYGGRGYGVVGGMVGFNYGIIENCTAAMKSVSFLQTSGCTDTTLLRNIGGLVGSMNDKSIVKNCYTSGTLIGSVGAGKLMYGGIAGGHQVQSDERNMPRKIINSYSTCEWDKAVQVNGANYAAICPAGSNITMSNCYYLTDVVGTGVSLTATDGVTGKSYEELASLSSLPEFGMADADHTFPWPGFRKAAYPFPGILRAGDGKYAHYGNWYGVNQLVPSALMVYYEQYQMEATGEIEWRYTYLKTDGRLISNLPKNKGKILSCGYGLLIADQSKPLPVISGPGITNLGFAPPPAGAEKISTAYGSYALRPFDDKAVQALNPGTLGTGIKLSLPYQMTESDTGTTTSHVLEYYINIKFAEGLSTKQNLSTKENPLRIRTLPQLQKMTKGEAPQGGYFVIRENIWATGMTTSLINNGFNLNGGYAPGGNKVTAPGFGKVGDNGCYVLGLEVSLFDNVTAGSVVENLALLNVNIKKSGHQAALAINNDGTISQCLVQGTVHCRGIAGVQEASGQAAGLVVTNKGTIAKSYFNGTARAPLTASSLVASNLSGGTITDCFTGGTVLAKQTAGFAYENYGTITNCYSLSNVSAGEQPTQFGFTGSDKPVANCYWVQNTKGLAWNDTVNLTSSRDGALVNDLNRLTSQAIGTNWKKASIENTFAFSEDCQGKAYPNYKLTELDFYGDWPIAVRVTTGAPLMGLGFFQGGPTTYGAWMADDGLNIAYVNSGNPTYISGNSDLLVLLPKDASKYSLQIVSGGEILPVTATRFTLYPGIPNYTSYRVLYGYQPVFWQIEALLVKDLETNQEVKLNFSGTDVTAEWVE